ncbi:hypothetical protein L198_01649 [Cryptococcus wingfieldii CBS 7118]|uniref:Uncharacterized protein n=1 Tax=Cryptococcus wingfieldii CBS 7118 TaxID=1295528 RepID=A0A1E3K1V3_9TREE|nr:hypothetical protein L198_01649 [Cryptococcus wingfieldii CBS 7118]ODO06417.1 hypothetical protein L198_01649 [Cryptococcus wingfieldii CBS 7118]
MVPQENPRKFAWINTSRKRPSSAKQRKLTQPPLYASQSVSKPVRSARKPAVTNENELTPQVAKKRPLPLGLPTPAATDKPDKGKGRAQDRGAESRDSPMPLRGGGRLMVGSTGSGGMERFKVHGDGESSKSKTPTSTRRSPMKEPNDSRQRPIPRTPNLYQSLSPARRSPDLGSFPVESELETPEPICGTDTMRRVREINGIPPRQKAPQASPTKKRKRGASSGENAKSPRMATRTRSGKGERPTHRTARGLPLAEHPSSDNDPSRSPRPAKKSKQAEPPHHFGNIFARPREGKSAQKSSPSSHASRKSTPVRSSSTAEDSVSPIPKREPLTPKKTPRRPRPPSPAPISSPSPRHIQANVRTGPNELTPGASQQSFELPARQTSGGPSRLLSSLHPTGEQDKQMVYHHESFDLVPPKGMAGGVQEGQPQQAEGRVYVPVDTSETLFMAGNDVSGNVLSPSVREEEHGRGEEPASARQSSRIAALARSSPSGTESFLPKVSKKPIQTPVREWVKMESQESQQSQQSNLFGDEREEAARNLAESDEGCEAEAGTLDPALNETYADNNLFQSHPEGRVPTSSQSSTGNVASRTQSCEKPSQSREEMPIVATTTKTRSPQQQTPQRTSQRIGGAAMGQMATSPLPASASRRPPRRSQRSRDNEEDDLMDEESDLRSSQLGPTQSQGLFQTIPREASLAASPSSTQTTPTQPMRQSQFTESPVSQHGPFSPAELASARLPDDLTGPGGSDLVAQWPDTERDSSPIANSVARGPAVVSGEKPRMRKRKQRGEAISPQTSGDVLIGESDDEGRKVVSSSAKMPRQAAADTESSEKKEEDAVANAEGESEKPQKRDAFSVLMGPRRSISAPRSTGKGKDVKGKGKTPAKSTPKASTVRKPATRSATKRKTPRAQPHDEGQTSLPSQGFFKNRKLRKTEDQIRSFDKAFSEEEDHDFEEEQEEGNASAGPSRTTAHLSGKPLISLLGRVPHDPRLNEGGKREIRRRRLVERAQATLKRTPSPLTPLSPSPSTGSPLPPPPGHRDEAEEDEDVHPFGEEMRQQASREDGTRYRQSQATTSGSQTSAGVKTPGSTKNFIDMLGGSSSQIYD